MEAAKCAVIASEVSEKQASCERDLAAAEPLVQQAEAALDTLNKKDLGETKSLKKPPPGVFCAPTAVSYMPEKACLQPLPFSLDAGTVYRLSQWGHAPVWTSLHLGALPAGVDDITAVVIILLEGNPKDKSWAAAAKLMNNVDKFLERLKGFKAVIDQGLVSCCKATEDNCTHLVQHTVPHL